MAEAAVNYWFHFLSQIWRTSTCRYIREKPPVSAFRLSFFHLWFSSVLLLWCIYYLGQCVKPLNVERMRNIKVDCSTYIPTIGTEQQTVRISLYDATFTIQHDKCGARSKRISCYAHQAFFQLSTNTSFPMNIKRSFTRELRTYTQANYFHKAKTGKWSFLSSFFWWWLYIGERSFSRPPPGKCCVCWQLTAMAFWPHPQPGRVRVYESSKFRKRKKRNNKSRAFLYFLH